MYSSHNVCEFFGVSRETVRTWSGEFQDWLSPTANPEKGRARQFTDADLRVFSLVASMKQQGLLYSDIKASLGAGQRGELPDTIHAVVPGERNKLAELENRVRELQEALSDAVKENERKAGQIEALTHELDEAKAKIDRLNREIGRLERDTD